MSITLTFLDYRNSAGPGSGPGRRFPRSRVA